MRTSPLARALGALVALAVVAAVLFVALLTLLAEFGVPRWAASPGGVGAVVTVVLAAADAFTPLGNVHRATELQAKATRELALDFLVAGLVGFVLGYVGALVVLSPDASGLRKTVVVSLAVVMGYGTFVGRNLAVYGIAPTTDPDTDRQP